MTTSRFVTVAAMLVLAGTHVDAQFRRGLPQTATTIDLFPVMPPAVVLPAGSFDVEVRNASAAPARLVSRLEEAITAQMSGNDRRLAAVETGGAMQVVATITKWTHTRRQGKRFVPEVRQLGSQNVASGEGNTYTEPLIDYGRDRPNVVDKGAATIRIEVRRGSEIIANETASVTFLSDKLLSEVPPSVIEIEHAIIDRAAEKSAGLITPAREPVAVQLARSDEVERLNALAANRWWTEWRDALQQRTPHPDPKRDAYRLYNIGVALEALAYELTTVEDTQRMLQEAAGFVQQAIAARKGEKQFAESLARISANSAGYGRLRDMLRDQQPHY